MSLRRSLVIPAFNEAARLRDGFARLAPTLEQWGPDETELVFVDDGSSDATLKTIAAVFGHLPHVKVIQHPENRGKGAAVRTGWASAKAPVVITVDADMAIEPRHYDEVALALERVDVALGDRSAGGAIRYQSTFRTVAGALFHRVVTHYTGITERDTQCGCKGFRLEGARLLGLLGTIDGFAYDAELLYLAPRLGLTITSVPVSWRDVGGSSVRAATARSLLRDLRDIPRTSYENPVVVLAHDIDVAEVRAAATAVRQRGLVVARRAADALVVLPRDAGLNAIALREALEGELAIVDPSGLRGSTFVAV